MKKIDVHEQLESEKNNEHFEIGTFDQSKNTNFDFHNISFDEYHQLDEYKFFFGNNSKNEQLKDDGEMFQETEFLPPNHIYANKGLEEQIALIYNDNNSKSKESDTDKPDIINEKKEEDNTNENSNKKQKENLDCGIKTIKEENPSEEKPKEILYIEIKKEKNIIENKKEENIVVSNNKNKNIFNVTKVNNDLFNNLNLFNLLISIEKKSEIERSQRKSIRDKIKEIREAFKENKLENIVYTFNQDIFFNSKEKDEILENTEKRKFRNDDIYKKIKTGFFKDTINCLNKDLKCANSEKYFAFLPQCFVRDITKNGNGISILNMTFEELIKIKFYEEKNEINKNLGKKRKRNKKKEISVEEIQKMKKKYKKNQDLLEYLETNKEISKKINFDIIKKTSYRDLLMEYLESHEFEESVLKLLKEHDTTEKYIINYIVKAFGYINYFSKSKK